MQRTRTRLWLLLVLLLWIPPSLQAQQQAVPTTTPQTVVPRLIKFAGSATDTEGKVLSGTLGITLAIYKEQYEGAPLWLETQNIQADAKGNYTVQLGATKPEGLPLDLFSSGDARWLGVAVNGGQEQPRVLLLSVPYALKAADAETVGGLPPTAFVLATPPSGASSGSTSNGVATSANVAPSPLALTGGGTANTVPLWTSSSNLGNSNITQSGGIVSVADTLQLPATGVATATAGKNSQPLDALASSFSGTLHTAILQHFRWQAEAVGNNTSSPSGSLKLLYNSGTGTPAETGLSISSNGRLNFAVGQTFPGSGTVKSVGLSAPSSDFTVSGSPVTGSGTLSLAWNVAPTSASTANAIVKRDASGNFSAGAITAASLTGGGAVFSSVSAGSLASSSLSSGVSSLNLSTSNGGFVVQPVTAGGIATVNIKGGFSGNSVGGTGLVGDTVAGGGASGNPNTASGTTFGYATVGGGVINTASGDYSTVGGGVGNAASGDYSTVGGGADNGASGQWSTVPGGFNNIASGTNSFAAGDHANASDDHSFVWCATGGATCGSLGTNSFTVSMQGPFSLFVGAGGNGCQFKPGDSGWTCTSDRSIKENFTAIQPREILLRLIRMPIQQWNMKGVPAAIKHVGPVAQDFYAAFGLGGNDDRHISQGDAQGVAMAAIQALYQLVQEKDGQIQKLNTQLQELRNAQSREVTELEERLMRIEAQVRMVRTGSMDQRGPRSDSE